MSKADPPAHREGFIFFDQKGRRWPRLRLVLAIVGSLALLASVLFVAAVWIRPAVRLNASVLELKGKLKAEAGSLDVQPIDSKANSWELYQKKAVNPTATPSDTVDQPIKNNHSLATQERLGKLREQLQKGSPGKREVRLGFYVDWDANALASLHEHADQLTHLAPEWFSITGPEAQLIVEPDPPLAQFCAANGITVMPVLRNLAGDIWQPEAVENLARGPAMDRTRFCRELTNKITGLKAGGILLDWNELDPAYRNQYTQLIGELSKTLHKAGKELWLAVSMDDELAAYDLEELGERVDRFVALMFDEHSESDQPGPLASLDWIQGWLKVIKERGDPDQWVLALGAYATDWNATRKDAETISFRDAMSRASYAGVDQEGHLAVAKPHYNGRYAYSEPGGEHTVFFLDAISFYNQLRTARSAGFSGLGVQRLGTEDPQIWDVLAHTTDADRAFVKALSQLHTDKTVTHVGRGEIVSVDDTHDDGTRELTVEPDGRLRATYTDFPTYPVLYHQGAGDKHLVALTFDDGPDPKWTPKVLDILQERGVKAAFFVVGRNAEDYPDLLQRIAKEGHEIGNHTYTHGNLAELSEWRMRLELGATERLVESLTGYSTTLFRPPYNADSTPSSLEELVPLRFAEKELGYTVVLEKIDPQDWALPGVETILQRVKEMRSQGNIILLHDAGGDRHQTIEALPRIIDWLTERGDHIVSLGELLHIPREDLMPPVQATAQTGVRAIAATGFRLWHWFVEVLWAFMIFATGLVVLRSLLIAWLAWRHHRREDRRPMTQLADAPPISVLIAAYNEGRIIDKTLHSVLDCDYPGKIEVVVVDDGSKDDTVAVVENFAANEPRVRLLRQKNLGKSVALSHALAESRHEILVFLDADTLFEKQTISRLVEPFVIDPKTASVSGNARVGNVHNFITRCQQLEYICGFNLDRRAYTMWHCIPVVPGAVSALRRSAIEAAGGFSHDTLAEDTDMTLALHKLGYHISYAADAVAWTEAPEKWRSLARQRSRWAFGTMQALWKHRELLFNPKYRALAFFAMPSIWFFQVILVAITPLADAILLYSIAVGYAVQLWQYFLIFLLMDLFLAALACRLEGEPVRGSLLIVPMRFVYRWLLAFVVWRSILRALRGALVGWGKLDRHASVPSRA